MRAILQWQHRWTPRWKAPQFDDLYPVGTLAKLLRVIELPDQKTTAIIQAYGRVALHEGFTQQAPFIVAPRDLSS